MLDNMTDEQYRLAVELSAGRVMLEASGNMNRERLLRIQDIGIDVVSIGWTHSSSYMGRLIDEDGLMSSGITVIHGCSVV